MHDNQSWTCPTCDAAVDSVYCPTCGERPLQARDLTLRGLFEQIFHALTSIDSRLVRSVRCLARPGFLTLAYLQGRRKPYIGPVPLFLMANVLFFAAESLTAGTVFTTPLRSHLHTQPWSPLAGTLVAHRLEALHTTVDAFGPTFDREVALHARSLIIVMALSFTLLPWIVFRRRKCPVVAHAVFSLHLYAFLLSLLSLAVVVSGAELWLRATDTPSRLLDNGLSVALLLACAMYLYLAIGAVYAARGTFRAAMTIVLTVGVGTIVLGYRFALFVFTLYTA